MDTTRSLSAISLSLLLTFGSALVQADDTVTKTTTVAEKQPITRNKDKEVGISNQDGISTSGGDVLITRNGVSEKVTKEITLKNGTRIEPDGTMILKNGEKVPMRPTQTLTFDGQLLDPQAPATTETTVQTETTVPAAPAGTAAAPAASKPALNKQAQDAANAEAERRARSTEDKPRD